MVHFFIVRFLSGCVSLCGAFVRSEWNRRSELGGYGFREERRAGGKSHHENNYGGALRNLNKVEAAVASVSKDTPPFVVAGLKEHELAFENLGADGKATGELVMSFGDTFRAIRSDEVDGRFGRASKAWQATQD